MIGVRRSQQTIIFIRYMIVMVNGDADDDCEDDDGDDGDNYDNHDHQTKEIKGDKFTEGRRVRAVASARQRFLQNNAKY